MRDEDTTHTSNEFQVKYITKYTLCIYVVCAYAVYANIRYKKKKLT